MEKVVILLYLMDLLYNTVIYIFTASNISSYSSLFSTNDILHCHLTPFIYVHVETCTVLTVEVHNYLYDGKLWPAHIYRVMILRATDCLFETASLVL